MTQDRRDQQLLEVALAAGSAGRHKADLEGGLESSTPRRTRGALG